ncbi:MAG: hypothetical protein IIT58_00740, partial [Treponema sp.]|nr:hypothetical protein [Treponema sp.]
FWSIKFGGQIDFVIADGQTISTKSGGTFAIPTEFSTTYDYIVNINGGSLSVSQMTLNPPYSGSSGTNIATVNLNSTLDVYNESNKIGIKKGVVLNISGTVTTPLLESFSTYPITIASTGSIGTTDAEDTDVTTISATSAEIVNNGKIFISGDAASLTASSISGTGEINLNGTSNILEVTNDSSIGILNITNSSSISGSFEIGTLNVDTSTVEADTTVTFANGSTQTVSSDISVKGHEDYYVTLTSDTTDRWTIDMEASVASSGTFSNARVSYSDSVNKLALVKSASTITEGEPSSTTNWFNAEFIWKGLTSNAWGIATNWDAGAVPPANSSAGYEVDVVIATADGGSDPVLGDAIDLNSLTINAGCSLDDSGYGITCGTITNSGTVKLSGAVVVSGTTFTNNGTVRLTGAETISYGTIENGTGTVEYYGGSTTAASWGTEYNNLLITGACNIATELNVPGTTEINTTGNVTLSSTENDFTGLFTVIKSGDLTIGCSTVGNKIIIDEANDVVFTQKSTSTDQIDFCNVNAASLLITSTKGTAGLTGSITTSGNQTYDCACKAGTFHGETIDTTTVTGDEILFKNTVTISRHLDINASTSTIMEKKVSGTKKLIFSGVGKTYLYADIAVRTVECEHDLEIGDTSAVTITTTADNTYGGGYQLYKGNVKLNQNLISTAKLLDSDTENIEICFNNPVSASGKTLTFGSGSNESKDLVFKSDVTCLEISSSYIVSFANESSTAVSIVGEGTYSNSVSITGKTIFESDNTFTSFSSSANTTFNGDNTFGTFSAATADTTYVFKAGTTQRADVFSVSGTDADHRITLRSDSDTLSGTANQWIFVYTGAQTDAATIDANVALSNVYLQNSYNGTLDTSSNHVILTANDSKDGGNNTYWNMPGNDYIWKGSTNSSWNTNSNWQNNSVPGYMVDVLIDTASGGTNPVLTSSDKSNYVLDVLTVNAGSSLDFAGQGMVLAKIVNHGTVRLTGAETLETETGSAAVRDNGDTTDGFGAVVYYGGTAGAPTSNPSWGADYANLTVEDPVSFASGNTFTVSKNLIVDDTATFGGVTKITGTTTIDTTGDVSFSSTLNEFTGLITVAQCQDLTLNAAKISNGVTVTTVRDVTINSAILNSNVSVASADDVSITVTGTNLNLGAISSSSLAVTNASFTTNLKGNVTTNTIQTYSTAVNVLSAITLQGTVLTFNKNVTTSAALVLDGSNITFVKPVSYGANLSVEASESLWFKDSLTYTNGAELTLSGAGTVTCTGNVTAGKVTCSATGNGTFNGNISIAGAASFANQNTFKGTVTLAGVSAFANDNIFEKTVTATAVTTFEGTNTFGAFETTANAVFNANNTFTSFTATGAGAIYTFKNGTTQTVGAMTVTGTSESLIKLQSDSASSQWKIVYNGTPADVNTNVSISYAEIKDSFNETDTLTPVYLTCNNGKDSGNNDYWNFPGAEYIWLGTTSDSWKERSNWNVGSIPGNDTKVVIATTASTGTNPKLVAGDTVLPVVLRTLTVNSGSTLESDGQNVTVTEAIENNGTITLSGSSAVSGTTITNNGTMRLTGAETISGSVSNGTTSTVIYYGGTAGSPTTNPSWGSSYANLTIEDPVNFGSGNSFTVSKDLTVDDNAIFGGTVTVGGIATVNGASSFSNALTVTGNTAINAASTFTGAVTLKSNATVNAASSFSGVTKITGTTTINTTGDVSFSSTSNEFTGAINVTNCGDLTLNATITQNEINVTNCGVLSLNIQTGKNDISITECKDCSILSNTELRNITIQKADDVTIDAKKIKDESKIKIADAKDIVVDSQYYLTFLDVNGKSFKVTVPAYNISLEKNVTTTERQAYNATGYLICNSSPVDLTGSEIEINCPSDFYKNVNVISPVSTFNGAVRVFGTSTVLSVSTTDSSSGTTTFKSTVTLGGDLLITTNGRATFNGAVDCSSASAAALTLKGTGTTYVNASIGAGTSSSYLKSITAATSLVIGQTVPTADLYIKTSMDQIYDGQNSGATTLSANATFTVKGENGTIYLDQLVDSVSANQANLTLSGEKASSTIYIEKSLGATNALKDISVENAGLLKIGQAHSPVSIRAVNFGQTGSGLVQLAADMVCSQSIDFASDTYVDGQSGFAATGDEGIAFAGELFVSAAEKSINFASGTKISGNFALFNGNVKLADNIKFAVSKDIVLLNGTASTMDDDPDGTTGDSAYASGVAGLYSYRNDGRPHDSSVEHIWSLDSYPTQMPDGTAIDYASYDSSLTGSGGAGTLSGQTISAGKNFYDNGVALTGSSTWTLKLPDNDSSKASFAELYNAEISHCSVVCSTTSGKAYLAAAERSISGSNDGGNNSGVYFSRPVIDTAYTVYDDVIFVRFKDSLSGEEIKIENSNNEISAAVEQISNSDGKVYSAFTDSACSNSTDGAGDISSFYLKSSVTWNTDATGSSAGDAQSTDAGRGASSTDVTGLERAPQPKTVIPYIDIEKASSTLYATLRDEHKNRIAHYTGDGQRITQVQDRCSPVLVAVRVGQELHSAPGASQQDFDSHNFIEYQYSEAVSVEGLASSDTNLQSTASLGGITNAGSSIDSQGFTVAGLSSFDKGNAFTYVQGVADSTTVHSLYRKFATEASAAASASFTEQTHRLRLGLCSYVDGTVSAGGSSYKHWKGYIDGSTAPSGGTVTRLANSGIKDCSAAQNVLSYENPLSDASHILPVLKVEENSEKLYGAWDSVNPAFAAYISYEGDNTDDASEIFGWNEVGSTVLKSIEFHVWDNGYDFTSSAASPKWYTQIGWQKDNHEYALENSYAADIFGGSRAFDDEAARRTSGGIRYSTL